MKTTPSGLLVLQILALSGKVFEIKRKDYIFYSRDIIFIISQICTYGKISSVRKYIYMSCLGCQLPRRTAKLLIILMLTLRAQCHVYGELIKQHGCHCERLSKPDCSSLKPLRSKYADNFVASHFQCCEAFSLLIPNQNRQ